MSNQLKAFKIYDVLNSIEKDYGEDALRSREPLENILNSADPRLKIFELFRKQIKENDQLKEKKIRQKKTLMRRLKRNDENWEKEQAELNRIRDKVIKLQEGPTRSKQTNLQKLREELGLSKALAVELVGEMTGYFIHLTTYKRQERGSSRLSDAAIEAYSTFYNIDPDKLVKGQRKQELEYEKQK